MRLRFTILLLAVMGWQPLSAAESLSVTVLVFDPGIPDDPVARAQVFPEVREVESLLWTYELSRVLGRFDAFDIVRISTRDDNLAEVTVFGRIVESDGVGFTLQVSARDAAGDTWIDRLYSINASDTDYASVFEHIGKDLVAEAIGLSSQQRQRLREISLLRYGSRLAPTAFGDYLDIDEDGRVTVLRLPSRDDVMINRLRRVREATFLVSDVIDEKFADINRDVRKVYAVWRNYREQNKAYQAENLRRGSDGLSDYQRGSYEAYKRAYDLYKWDRQTVQEQDRLAVAFDNEVGGDVDALRERVRELLVWVDSKNAEWYRLLEALFEVELRQEPPPEDPGETAREAETTSLP